jgi:hypothetical protein
MHFLADDTDQNVGAGLPAMASVQAEMYQLTHRHRSGAAIRQASPYN